MTRIGDKGGRAPPHSEQKRLGQSVPHKPGVYDFLQVQCSQSSNAPTNQIMVHLRDSENFLGVVGIDRSQRIVRQGAYNLLWALSFLNRSL